MTMTTCLVCTTLLNFHHIQTAIASGNGNDIVKGTDTHKKMH